MYDYLVVGAGLSGATFAHFVARANKRVIVIDRRSHIAGNAFTERLDEIEVHRYGPHLFHTNARDVWEFVTSFSHFVPYRHTGRVFQGGHLYPFPINLMTLHQVFGVTSPAEAAEVLAAERVAISEPGNLEEYALSQIGERLYRLFIYGYTKKQWNREPRDLPASILKRIPLRLTHEDAYFSDTYQGVPADGYTAIVERMLQGVPVELGVDYHTLRGRIRAKRVVYTGPIDRFFDYELGKLDYRSLRFEHQSLDIPDYQGTAVVNYPGVEVPFTRIIEHKHFVGAKTGGTWISREFPADYVMSEEPYYPINDERNSALYRRYREIADKLDRVIFLGRLARYAYYDMHQVVAAAMKSAAIETS